MRLGKGTNAILEVRTGRPKDRRHSLSILVLFSSFVVVNNSKSQQWCTKLLVIMNFVKIKGGKAKMRLPETVKCSKYKICRPMKLKHYYYVYLIWQTLWQCFSFLDLQVLDWEHFKVSGGLVFGSLPFTWGGGHNIAGNYVLNKGVLWYILRRWWAWWLWWS